MQEPTAKPPARFPALHREQMVFRPVDVEQLLEPDHLARAEKAERRASETDPEARRMKQGDGGSAPRHDVQISTDAAYAIMVGARVTQEANDQQQLLPAGEEIQRQNGRAPGQMIVDDGYTTRENVLTAAGQQAWELIGTGNVGAGAAEATVRRLEKRGVAPEFYPQNFSFDAAANTYTCPAGKTLPYRYTKHDRVGVARKAYRARVADCRACAFRQQCCPCAPSRTLVHTENVPAVAAYIARQGREGNGFTYPFSSPRGLGAATWVAARPYREPRRWPVRVQPFPLRLSPGFFSAERRAADKPGGLRYGLGNCT